MVGGALEFETDWRKIVERSLALIDAKRAALKLPEYSPTRFAKSETYIPADAYSFAEYDKGKYTRK